jgi:hypothetical protein
MNTIPLLMAAWGLAGAPAAAAAETKSVHVFVALADNAHQGIVKVPAKLGDGGDPANNLYWGARYGVRAFFKASADWDLLSTEPNPAAGILERCTFRHKKSDVVLLADAYQGAEIKKAVADFLAAAGGGNAGELEVSGKKVRIRGGADLVAYVGHNGLMDFTLDEGAVQGQGAGRDAIVLACKSKEYFAPWLDRLKARPVLLTTGLMAPEAYTLHAALEGWIAGAKPAEIREKASAAYHQYQKCGMSGARSLFDAVAPAGR